MKFQPLLEQHLRVRVSPVIREDGSGSNTYNIEAISSSDSDTTDSDTSDENANQTPSQPAPRSDVPFNTTNEDDHGMEEEYADLETLSDDDSSSSSSSRSTSMNNDEPLAGFSPNLEPVNASWNSSSNDSNSQEATAHVIQNDNHEEI